VAWPTRTAVTIDLAKSDNNALYLYLTQNSHVPECHQSEMHHTVRPVLESAVRNCTVL